MIWLVLLALLIIGGAAVFAFYRHSQNVESELGATSTGAPPPMFGTIQGKIRRNTE